ncbi:MAG: outermembrane Hek-like protein [Candidatus Desulfovibrio kirbyi]|uniref:Outermembrane Hek-like protein n=1 Tax=Candidatus Desulfovibrio kirbyi TaxID=2696086 RepID=A0A6L2R5N0_9BACT|nr:MAG: outermembrane Hek-like protein [Candidatus Desulfovibrio kirbyi]
MKRALAIVVFIAGLAAPALSAAEGTGMYLAPKFLVSIQDSGRIHRSAALAGSGVSDYSQFTLGGALAAGYDFWPQHMLPIRAEIELALRGDSEKKWNDDGRNLNKVNAIWNNSTLFANLFWDFRNDTLFTPYVGAGLGVAFKYAGFDYTTAGGDKFTVDDRFNSFAWNVGAGVAYSFAEQLTVDAGYRFVSLGNDSLTTHYGGQKYEVSSSPYNNEFTLGLRFSF